MKCPRPRHSDTHKFTPGRAPAPAGSRASVPCTQVAPHLSLSLREEVVAPPGLSWAKTGKNGPAGTPPPPGLARSCSPRAGFSLTAWGGGICVVQCPAGSCAVSPHPTLQGAPGQQQRGAGSFLIQCVQKLLWPAELLPARQCLEVWIHMPDSEGLGTCGRGSL